MILEIGFLDLLVRRRFFDSAAYRATPPRRAELAAFITAFPVSGVFTFVRGETLTTAGLRGSRVAEPITALAASDRIAAPVQELMSTGRVGWETEPRGRSRVLRGGGAPVADPAPTAPLGTSAGAAGRACTRSPEARHARRV